MAHQVINGLTDAGGINGDVDNVIHAAKVADLARLSVKIETIEALLVDNTEHAALYLWRGNDHQRGVVLTAAGVVANPHRHIAKRASGERGVVLPHRPGIDHTALQFGHLKNAVSVVDELAHQQIFKLAGRELDAQFFQGDAVKAAVDGVLDGNQLAEIAVFAQPPLFQCRMRHIQIDMLRFWSALVEMLPRPQRIGFVGRR